MLACKAVLLADEEGDPSELLNLIDEALDQLYLLPTLLERRQTEAHARRLEGALHERYTPYEFWVETAKEVRTDGLPSRFARSNRQK